MNDFHEQYLNLPNKDLIRITSNPDNYQPAAVTAATAILSTRTVTNEDYDLARAEDEKEEKWLRMRPPVVDKVLRTRPDLAMSIRRARDLIVYLVTPSEKFEVRKWIIIICLFYGGAYILGLINDIKHFILFFSCNSCRFSAVEAALSFDLVYIPAMIYLLIKKNIIGWGLLVATIAIGLLLALGYLFTSTGIFDQLPKLLVEIGIRSAILFFILKKEVRNYFKKPPKEEFEHFLEETSAERTSE